MVGARALRRATAASLGMTLVVTGAASALLNCAQASTTVPGDFRVVASVSVPPTYVNAGVAVDPVAHRVYATNSSGDLYVYDQDTLGQIADIPVGVDASTVVVDPENSRAYVGYDSSSATAITVVDTATETVVAAVTTGSDPSAIAIDDSASRVYVTNTDSNTLSVIDSTGGQVVATVPVPDGSPISVAVNPSSDQIFVAESAGNLVTFDGSTLQVTADVSLGQGAGMIAVDPKSGHVFVPTNTSGPNGTLVTVDGANSQVIASTNVGYIDFYDPQALFDSRRQWIYVGSENSGGVAMVDATTFQVLGGQDVAGPMALADDPAEDRLFAFSQTDDPQAGTAEAALYEYDTPTDTSTSLSSGSQFASYGQSVVITATVTPTDGGGSVEYFDNGSPIAGCETVSLSPLNDGTATATCSTNALPVGSDTVRAVYSGDTSYASSDGTLSQQVIPGNSSTSLNSDLNPSSYDQTVTFTATVAPNDTTGTVEYFDNGSPIAACETVSLSSNDGKAICETNGLTPGTHQIEAAYSGDSNYAPSDGTLTQTVNRAPTRLTAQPAIASLNPPDLEVLNLSVTLVDAQNGQPLADKTVSMSAGSAQLCTATTNSNGTAACTATNGALAVLTNDGYTATFAGDTLYTASTATAELVRP